MYCAKCGTRNPDYAKFCQQCGNKDDFLELCPYDDEIITYRRVD